MKVTGKHLDRLLRSAAAAPAPLGEEMPARLQARVLTGLRKSDSVGDLAFVITLLRAGLACACLLVVLSSILSFRGLEQTSEDAFATSNAMVRLVSLP